MGQWGFSHWQGGGLSPGCRVIENKITAAGSGSRESCSASQRGGGQTV